jgi:flagellar biosynthetic protein FliR
VEYWLDQFHVFLLVLLRVSALLMVAPIFGHRTWLARAKVGLAFTVSIILYPLVAETTPEIPAGVLPYALMMIKEILMGVVMGFVVLLLFVGIQFAGQLAGLQMGFGIVNVIDPQSSNHVSIMGQFLNVLAILLLLSLNGHHTILTGLVTSFETIPLGGVELKVGLMYKMITLTTQVFVIAIQISAPIMTALFLVTVALGVLARTVPQMNVFMVGFPVQITVGLGAFLVCLPLFGMLVERLIVAMRRDLLVMVDLMH